MIYNIISSTVIIFLREEAALGNLSPIQKQLTKHCNNAQAKHTKKQQLRNPVVLNMFYGRSTLSYLLRKTRRRRHIDTEISPPWYRQKNRHTNIDGQAAIKLIMKKKAKRKETKFASNMGDNNQEPSIKW